MQQSTQDYEQEPSLTEPEIALPKQQTKTKLLTPLNIMIILASLALVGMGSYYLFSLGESTDMKSMINESHANIKTVADSNSQKDGSSTGSDSSKTSSTNNNKPNAKSPPASKDIISSNNKLTGGTGGRDDEDDEGSDKPGKNSGGSTEIDSEEDSEEEDSDDEANNEPIVWVDKNAPASQGATPMVGSARDGGR